MAFLYNLFLLIVTVVLSGLFAYRLITGEKYRFGLRQKLGWIPKNVRAKRDGRPLIWIQAVSVGEVLAAKPLLDRIRQVFPGHQLLISTTTKTGYEVCQDKVVCEEDICICFPIDYFWIVRHVLRLFRPALICLIETELWPNFVWAAHRMGIPITLINGRISRRSYRGYRRFRFLMERVLRCFASLGMQTEEDAERIISIGAPRDRVRVTNSLKYDGAGRIDPDSLDETAIRAEIKVPAGARILTAGSTHYYEEEVLTEIYTRLHSECNDLVLILAPRHPDRVPRIKAYLDRNGLAYNLKSALSNGDRPFAPIVVIDTLGELLKFYRIASVVFVGKSLTQKGGHNPIEPAVFAKPIIFGPYMDNFEEAAGLLVKAGGGMVVHSPDELRQAILDLLADPRRADEMGRRARDAVLSHMGAVENSIRQMQQALDSTGAVAHDSALTGVAAVVETE
ncbi:MAG: 3-deoxy-D-manno-octulosonic acid transferase [Verrucomicrobia bacterium]|nr:3-deoxy-D-manno-octulosonic acid transferase [Verrucomicrobiota bacterium]